MKKTVLKTVGFTLLGVLLTLVVFFGVFFFVAPGILGNASKALGNHDATVYFYQRHYDKAGHYDNLSRLVYELDAEKDSEKTEKYVSIVLDDMGGYLAIRNEDFETELLAKEYFYNKCVIAMINNGNVEGAINRASEFVLDKDCGYTLLNPFRIIISTKGNSLGREDLVKLRAKLTLLSIGVLDKTLVNSDLQEIDKLIINA